MRFVINWTVFVCFVVVFFQLALICPSAAAQQFENEIHPLLVKYCFDCHGAKKQEGDLRLDRLPADWSNLEAVSHWVEVRDQLNLGEMPPKKAERKPTAEELAKLVDWVSDGVQTALRNRSAETQIVIRRLTKQQYGNTLRDLVGITLKDSEQDLPDEGLSTEGFAYKPAHVLVYEDLTRYRMSSDRPKSENAGLARWSHRRILSFSQHIGGLFGVPVATVDARFSSRFCSQCGAPGARAVRFDPAWLDQWWMQRILQSNDIRDAAMKGVARRVSNILSKNSTAYDLEINRPWVLRDGGSHFVCANRSCGAHEIPIDADENAAANIGLRFLRGVEGLRVMLSANGAIVRSIGYIEPGLLLIRRDAEQLKSSEPYWAACDSSPSACKPKRRTGSQNRAAIEEDTNDDDDAGGLQTLFRDPSGTFRPNDRWFEGNVFWGSVARSCAAGISGVSASFVGSEAAD